jgi:hypothetical protein
LSLAAPAFRDVLPFTKSALDPEGAGLERRLLAHQNFTRIAPACSDVFFFMTFLL